MKIEEQSPRGLLLIELAGLSITAAAVLVIAFALQLAIRVLTSGALVPELGPLAFGFLFYVCAAFVAAGTSRRPAQALAPLGNGALSIAFLIAGYFLFRSSISASWLGLALLSVLLMRACMYGFALLRGRRIAALQARAGAGADAFLERFLIVRSQTYVALPIGAALGTWLGATSRGAPDAIVHYAAAGACAAIAAGEFIHLLAGASYLASPLTLSQRDERVRVGVAPVATRFALRVFAPEPSAHNIALGVEAAKLSALLRRVLLINQLQRLARVALYFGGVWLLSLPSLPASSVAVGLFGIALVLAPLPFWLGQEKANQRVLSPLSGSERSETRRRLSERAPAS